LKQVEDHKFRIQMVKGRIEFDQIWGAFTLVFGAVVCEMYEPENWSELILRNDSQIWEQGPADYKKRTSSRLVLE
jgi:hypothetical protein